MSGMISLEDVEQIAVFLTHRQLLPSCRKGLAVGDEILHMLHIIQSKAKDHRTAGGPGVTGVLQKHTFQTGICSVPFLCEAVVIFASDEQLCLFLLANAVTVKFTLCPQPESNHDLYHF